MMTRERENTMRTILATLLLIVGLAGPAAAGPHRPEFSGGTFREQWCPADGNCFGLVTRGGHDTFGPSEMDTTSWYYDHGDHQHVWQVHQDVTLRSDADHVDSVRIQEFRGRCVDEDPNSGGPANYPNNCGGDGAHLTATFDQTWTDNWTNARTFQVRDYIGGTAGYEVVTYCVVFTGGGVLRQCWQEETKIGY